MQNHPGEAAELGDGSRFESIAFESILHCGGKQRQRLGPGHLFQRVQRGVADAAGRLVDHTAEGLVIGRIDGQLEVGHHIFDLRPVEEGIAGEDHIRQVALAKGLFERTRLRIGAVQNGEIAVFALFFPKPRQDRARDQRPLRHFVEGADEADLFAFLPYRAALLRDAALIAGDHGIRRADNLLRRAVIALETEDAAAGEILLKAQNVADIRTAEGIDRLRIVADHAEVAMLPRQCQQNLVLRQVRVLILVDEDVVETRRDLRPCLREVTQQHVHIQQDIIEIHHPAAAALLLVDFENLVDLRLLLHPVHLAQLRGSGIGVGIEKTVLGHRNLREHFLRLVDLLVEPQLPDGSLDGALRIGSVVNRKGRRIAQLRGIVAQEADEHRMEGAHPDLPGLSLADHRGDALFHFPRRLFREGQGENPFRCNAPLTDEPGDARGQYPGLSRPCSGHDELRAVRTLHGGRLLCV